ncbi:PEGA domain-containing protein [Candidatus Uhrbacteria bacterium]|nr:PEGA domain-containing protein [Candidatus Uhrbacteria bacterium]
MSLIYRRIVFYLLFIAFIISAPLITAYTAGYRYSFTQKRIVKIGALSIDSFPRGVAIIINGEPITNTTPTLLTNLIPGRYTITLKNEGYYEWTKTLNVESERTTFAHDIPLFKINTPVLINTTVDFPATTSVSSFNQYKVFHENKQNKIVVIDNNTQKRLLELPGTQAFWHEKPEPLFFVASANEIWQWTPRNNKTTLITRLSDEILTVLSPPRLNALMLVQKNRVQALELDLRDQQNRWDLAAFEQIKTAALSGDGSKLFISGKREDKEGLFELILF